ncbi:hypothetical protein Q604_UNBC10709G0001, partial [human gut metagenome]
VDKTTGQLNQVTQTFQRLLPLREVFPQNQIDVLNGLGYIGRLEKKNGNKNRKG